MYGARGFLQILIKLEFSGRVFEKSSRIKFHENPFSGCRVVPSGRTNGHDGADFRKRLETNSCAMSRNTFCTVYLRGDGWR